jgi:hypothetical protein
MAYEYRKVKSFKDWLREANEKLNVEFSDQFWAVKTRNGIIHREGNIGYETRRRVQAKLVFKQNKDGGWDAFRDDPPPDDRWRFAEKFHVKKEERS